jgi:hypothetical protein
MAVNTPLSYKKNILNNIRRKIKNSALCPIQRFKHKAMRNGLEEKKEWRRWIFSLR